MSSTISIIIVTYNGIKWLDKCLASIFSQTYIHYEVIVVDNGSSDDSCNFICQHFPQVVLIHSKKNEGFASGNNKGVEHAKGDLLMFLNNDTRIEANFLERYIDAYETLSYDILGVSEQPYEPGARSKSGISSLTIDFFGHPFGDKTGEKVFYTNGACMMVTKDIYKETGGLDNNFFMYAEEVDRQRRCRLYGYTVGKLSDLYIHHAGAGSSSGNRIKYTTFLRRNQNTLQMLIKNYSLLTLIRVIPCYIIINLIEILVFFLVGKWMISFSYLQGWWYTLCSLNKSILPQRKFIQVKRIVADKKIMKDMYHGSAKIHHLLSFLYIKK